MTITRMESANLLRFRALNPSAWSLQMVAVFEGNQLGSHAAGTSRPVSRSGDAGPGLGQDLRIGSG